MDSILVTAIGSFAGELVITSLKRLKYRVVGCDIYPKEWVVSSKDVDAFYNVPKAVQKDNYLRTIFEICDKEKVQGIMPLTDVEIDLYCENVGLFEKKGIKLFISSVETLKKCRNKMTMYEYLKQKNIVTTIHTVEAASLNSCPPEFPVICKPKDGRSSEGLYSISDEVDWNYFIKKENLSNYIIQKRIYGSVIATDVIRDNHGNVVVIPREELLRTKNGAGTTVRVFYDSKLEKQCVDLANAIKTIGCVCFEFILSEDGNYHFLECNPRFGGGSKFSYLAGYDCIFNHIRAFENEEIDEFIVDKEMIISRRYSEYIMTED